MSPAYFVERLRPLTGNLSLTNSRNSLTGLPPMARTTATNSTTSNRRSPSYFAANDCGLPTRRASAFCVTEIGIHLLVALRFKGVRNDVVG